MMLMLDIGTSSSSATIWPMARSVPWPPSILPKNSVTFPSRPIHNQESRSVGCFTPAVAPIAACARTSVGPPIETAMTRAPVLCSIVRRDSENSVFAFIGSSSRHRVGCTTHGAHDRRMRAASALEPLERRLDLGIGRLLLGVEERRRRHDPAVDAVAALRNLLLQERLLHRMRLVRCAEPIEGLDLVTRGIGDRRRAGADRLAVEMHGARAALRQAAAEMRVRHAQIVAQ